MKIPFNKPAYLGSENKYILDAIKNNKLSGDGKFGKLCQDWFENFLNFKKTLLTPSCTHSLEMACLLLDIKYGDEVIMPSYTFVSTANAFIMKGAKIVFVDIRPDTLNIDENLIEDAITEKTKAVVIVHYAGVSCEMDTILDITKKHNLFLVEDAAQAMMSKYHNSYLGTFGDISAFSFHETKNYTSGGEGGLTIINNHKFQSRGEIIREKGTNRSQFFRGSIDKYTWVDLGSSYLPSELQSAYLWGQLNNATKILKNRLSSWNHYKEGLNILKDLGDIVTMRIPENCEHNAHMFYIKCEDLSERNILITFLKKNGINPAFHYIPLHNSPAGKKFGRFHGDDKYTTLESEKLLRLPLWYGMNNKELNFVIDKVISFYKK